MLHSRVEKNVNLYYNKNEMQMNINYLTDRQGNRVAVQIPFKEWSELVRDYNRLNQYHRLKASLKKSLHEIEEIESGKKSASTLSEFLDEC
jgi:poly(A) polymerase Pap1